jgi:hypothetical protein
VLAARSAVMPRPRVMRRGEGRAALRGLFDQLKDEIHRLSHRVSRVELEDKILGSLPKRYKFCEDAHSTRRGWIRR